MNVRMQPGAGAPSVSSSRFRGDYHHPVALLDGRLQATAVPQALAFIATIVSLLALPKLLDALVVGLGGLISVATPPKISPAGNLIHP